MDEALFKQLAQQELHTLEMRIEAAIEQADADCDVQMSADGILEVELEDGSKLVINQHAAMQEIWVAARTGAHHFRPADGRWVNTRDGRDLHEALAEMLATLSGGALKLTFAG